MHSARVIHLEMKQGLGSLASVASTAPWVGLLGSVFGIFSSFEGTVGSEESILAAVSGALSYALVPCALGLIVGLMALACYRYLISRIEDFAVQMESASLQLASDLAWIAN